MLRNLEDHLTKNFSFLHGYKLVLAVSGGVDSMVMADVFHKLNFEIAIAHCNFRLRKSESDEDEKFVKAFATKNNIPIFSMQFNTKSFAQDYKLSIQAAARELRYKWFYELLENEQYDYVLTAHHADDNLETFLINLSRGTGIEGLTGIPQQNNKIVRPMLAYSRNQIEDYAKENTIEWREDSSNASDKYLRNKIRHALAPTLKALTPDFLKAFQKTQNYLNQTHAMAEDASIMVYQQVARQNGDEIHFNIEKLKKLPNYKSYLYQWLHESGFTAWDDIYKLTDGLSGKQIFSPQYRLFKARHYLILAPKMEIAEKEYTINERQNEITIPLKLVISQVTVVANASNKVIFVDADKLRFPLALRRWTVGDAFNPSGMDGRSKKVSKLFKDEKLSVIEKENTWLLMSANQIVWVVGIRADERFKVSHATTNILQIALQE